jgi:glycosyltransferase involved in cell wall biosynthesis
LAFLGKLKVPEGYEAEVITITEADSVAGGYNQGMKASDAGYKVYLKETTHILNVNFIKDVIALFSANYMMGIMGITGVKRIPTDLVSGMEQIRYGMVKKGNKLCKWTAPDKYQEVEGLDEDILITSHDALWREDLFQKEGLLGLSQAVEFKRKGFFAAVPEQKNAWCEAVDLPEWAEAEKEAFLDEYSKDIFPLVSILMTTYNRPHYFRLALESALAQTYRNIEIIIGDDSTNDDTAKIVREYQKKYSNITYLSEKNPEKPSVCWRAFENHARVLHAAKGEYINYLNDDDLFLPEKLSCMMNYMRMAENIVLVTSFREMIDKDGAKIDKGQKPLLDKPTFLDGKAVGRFILENQTNFIGEPTTALVKKGLLKHSLGEYHKKLLYCNLDLGSWLGLCRFGNIVYLPQVLSKFRMHDGQNQTEIAVVIYGAADWGKALLIEYENGDFFADKKEVVTLMKKWLKFKAKYSFAKELVQQSIFYEDMLYQESIEVERRVREIIKSVKG